jgi:hypothetical protein
MARHLTLTAARQELAAARVRHIALLDDVRRHCIDENTIRDPFKHLSAVPIIYAAWEGYFKISFTLCIKRKCQSTIKARSYPGIYRTLWLQKQPFVQSYLSTLVAAMQPGKAISPKTGSQYKALASFSDKFSQWLDAPVDHASGFEDLVMTYSNVDYKVLALNSEVIGLDISGVPVGRLDGMVGRRNEISHGGLLTYPTESEVDELVTFCRNLISGIDGKIASWLKTS